MKPTAMKIIISVLMTMFFQSGHGMEKWYGDALCLAFRGEMKRSVQIVHNNASNLVEITDPKLVPGEIEHIIDGKSNKPETDGKPDDESKPGKFVAVSDAKVAYSTDGINWTSTSMPYSSPWSSVCYGNGKFVSLNDYDKAIYSTDGINWKETDMPAMTSEYNWIQWKYICYGKDKFVAMAEGDDSIKVAYSFDGIEWFPEEDVFWANWQAICYGKDKFVALTYENEVAYSNDGINWEKTDIPLAIDAETSVCYGNGKFVAVNGESSIAYSTDGITWIPAETPCLSELFSVCYGNGKFIAMPYGWEDSFTAYSTDGIHWARIVLPFERNYWRSVCYGNGKFVAVGESRAIYSTDGIYWEEVTSNFPDSDWTSIRYYTE